VVISVSQLRLGDFKRSVLDELDALADPKGRVDVRPLVRSYVESMASIQAGLRQLLESDLARWEGLFDSTIQRVSDSPDDEESVALLAARNADGKFTEETLFARRVYQRRRKLAERNKHLENLTNRVITNEVKSDD
jgi:hypothetical protein